LVEAARKRGRNGGRDAAALGGSFDGNIFQVLATLHPDHGWLV
jgi:hypothetical protein